MYQATQHATLIEIIRGAEPEDLDVLVDYITDSGKGRVALDKNACSLLVKARASQVYRVKERQLIEREIRRFGGNSIANLLRDVRGLLGLFGSSAPGDQAGTEEAVSYDEIVRDVAEHLKVKFEKTTRTSDVENGILKSLLIASLEKTTLEQREAILKDLSVPNAHEIAKRGVEAASAGVAVAVLSTVAGYQMSRMVASATLQALLGRALVVSASSFVARPVVALAGPIGWAITGAWALADMASPAYRVTVPCVVQVAYMRRKASLRIAYSPDTASSN